MGGDFCSFGVFQKKGTFQNWSCALWPASPSALGRWIYFCVCTAGHKSSSDSLSSAPSFVFPLKRGMWLSAGQSPALSPPEELGPQTLPHCILRCIVFQKGGTSPGSATVPLLRAPRASFPHSLIRLRLVPNLATQGSNLAIRLPLRQRNIWS